MIIVCCKILEVFDVFQFVFDESLNGCHWLHYKLTLLAFILKTLAELCLSGCGFCQDANLQLIGALRTRETVPVSNGVRETVNRANYLYFYMISSLVKEGN